MTGDYRRPPMVRLSVTEARRLAVRAQRLDGPAPRGRPDRAAILDVCRSLRCLQIDPTNVVARNHLLVLFSRLGAFDPALLERLAYEDHELFEYWAHEASLVLTEDLPLHRYLMRTWRHERAQRGGTSTPSSAPTSSTACAPTARCRCARSRTAAWRRGCPRAGPTSATSRACSTSCGCAGTSASAGARAASGCGT